MANAVQLSSSGTLLGNDGNWVTYSLLLGSPPKSIDVVPSTVLPDTWAISNQVCSGLSGNNLTNCQNFRGSTFQQGSSSSWKYLFDNSTLAFSLGIEGGYGWDQNNGGLFGQDTLILNTQKGQVPIQNAVIGVMNTNATATGLLGLASKQVSLTDGFNNKTFASNSTLQMLRDLGSIPSMSYSYSAGAYYNDTEGLLILGGYDAASFIPNSVPFTFAADPNNVLSVGLLSITATTNGNKTTLSDSTEQALIDSTVSELWLPESWCDAFAKYFSLELNGVTQLYTISSEALANNTKSNPTVTIEIADTQNANGNTVQINFPWSAFVGNYTNLNTPAYSNVPFFSLRKTSGPYTLGRSFLQEAVLTVDHERQNFSVSQIVDLRTHTQPQIVSISSASSTSSSGGGNGGGTSSTPVPGASSSGGGISGGAIGGIVVAVVVLAVAAIAGFFFWKRRQRRRNGGYSQAGQADLPGPSPLPPSAFNEKSNASEMPSPQPGNSDPMNNYHAQQRQNVKDVMAMQDNAHPELVGDMSHAERAQSPLPAYAPTGMHHHPQGSHTAAELSAVTASELHSEHASPMSSPHLSPPVSELAPSPGEEVDMGWNTPTGEPQSPHSAESIKLTPIRGAHIGDIGRRPNASNNAAIGSSNRGSEVLEMRATSGPLPLPLGTGLGIQDRETADNLRRQGSAKSGNSDITLVSGGANTLGSSSVSSALQSASHNTRRQG